MIRSWFHTYFLTPLMQGTFNRVNIKQYTGTSISLDEGCFGWNYIICENVTTLEMPPPRINYSENERFRYKWGAFSRWITGTIKWAKRGGEVGELISIRISPQETRTKKAPKLTKRGPSQAVVASGEKACIRRAFIWKWYYINYTEGR